MSEKQNKTPAANEQGPANLSELFWLGVLLGVCLAATSLMAPLPDKKAQKAPQPVATPVVSEEKTAERPGRERPGSLRERQWRDPTNPTLPGF